MSQAVSAHNGPAENGTPEGDDQASRLRELGHSVDMILEPKKLKWVLKHADRLGAARVYFVAPDEWQQGLVNVKDLVNSTDQKVAFENL